MTNGKFTQLLAEVKEELYLAGHRMLQGKGLSRAGAHHSRAIMMSPTPTWQSTVPGWTQDTAGQKAREGGGGGGGGRRTS